MKQKIEFRASSGKPAIDVEIPDDTEPKWRMRAAVVAAIKAKTNLTRANLTGADLTGADLTRANLTGANLTDANLTDANLTGAYMPDAYMPGATKDPIAVPVIEHIDAQILRALDAGGTLDMSSWHDHACKTTHCRAGWAITLAGADGKALEGRFGPHRAGSMIYRASRPGKYVPHFFATSERALSDIRECAAADPLPDE